MTEPALKGESKPERPSWSGYIFAEPFENVEWPEVSLSIRLIADAISLLPEEFHARRLEHARIFLAGRLVTPRRLSLIHELVVAEKEMEYWRCYLVSFSENDQVDMLKYARGALNDARRAHAKADAAIEREQRSFEKADAAEKAAAEKRAFIRERDALRYVEARAARKEKFDERERIRLADAEERRRRDADRRSASASAALPGSASDRASAPASGQTAAPVSTVAHPNRDIPPSLSSTEINPIPSLLTTLSSTPSVASPAAAASPHPSRRERRRHRKHRRVLSAV
jgi:hypothetical protein